MDGRGREGGDALRGRSGLLQRTGGGTSVDVIPRRGPGGDRRGGGGERTAAATAPAIVSNVMCAVCM